MMLPFLAAAIFAVTNAPSSFSTMVERTVPCPVISEPKMGMKFELDLPQSSDCRIEVAVGRDDDGDGALSDEESAITLAWSHNSIAVLGINGEVKTSTEYVPNTLPLSFVLKPGKGTLPHEWQLAEIGTTPLCAGWFEPNVHIPDFELARVRIAGSSASSLVVTPKRVHDVLVLTIR